MMVYFLVFDFGYVQRTREPLAELQFFLDHDFPGTRPLIFEGAVPGYR